MFLIFHSDFELSLVPWIQGVSVTFTEVLFLGYTENENFAA